MKMAQHFSAGIRSKNLSTSPCKRTAEVEGFLRIPGLIFSRPLRGLFWISLLDPTDKSLGYFHSVRFADEKRFRV